MPSKIDPKVRARCVQQMLERVAEYPTPTVAVNALANRNEVGGETVLWWFRQALIYSWERRGAMSEELMGAKALNAKVRELEKDVDILRRPRSPSRGSLTPRPLIAALIDDCRAAGHALESVCRVLSEHDRTMAGRTYRAWSSATQPIAARTVSDAIVMNAKRDAAWTFDADGPLAGVRGLTL